MDLIVPILPEDIISESRRKINSNFNTLAQRGDFNEQKLALFTTQIMAKIDKLEATNDLNASRALTQIEKLDSKIDNISHLEDIQKTVDDAIINASEELTSFIKNKANEQISESLGDYVTTSALDAKGYINSTSFEKFQSDAAKETASFELIVGNSNFYLSKPGEFGEDHPGGLFVYLDEIPEIGGTESNFSSVENYYNNIPVSERHTFDPNDKGINDPGVVKALINRCSSLFKTEVDELATFVQSVSDDSSATAIVNRIKGSSDAKGDITAAIFAEANEYGSSIKLNADQLNFTGHNITLSSGNETNDFRFQLSSDGLTVNTTNFKLDSLGNVTVGGIIHATGGDIGGIEINTNSIKSSNDKFSITSDGILIATNAKIGGEIYVYDSDGNINAGLLGSDTSETNDIRIFSGLALSPKTNGKIINAKSQTNNYTYIFVRDKDYDQYLDSGYCWRRQYVGNGYSGYEYGYNRTILQFIDDRLENIHGPVTKLEYDDIHIGYEFDTTIDGNIHHMVVIETSSSLLETLFDDAVRLASFTVDESGVLKANCAKIGSLEINNNEWGASYLTGIYYENSHEVNPELLDQNDGYYIHDFDISPEHITIHCGTKNIQDNQDESVSIAPLFDPDRWDQNGVIDVYSRSDDYCGIYVSRGYIYSNSGFQTSDGYAVIGKDDKYSLSIVTSLPGSTNNKTIYIVTGSSKGVYVGSTKIAGI